MPFTGTSMAQLNDLNNFITPYCAYWRVIGAQLGIPKGKLDTIEYDNFHKAQDCSLAMLEHWLEVDPLATEEKIQRIILSPVFQSTLKGNLL